MTLLMMWREAAVEKVDSDELVPNKPALDRLWLASDSRLSAEGPSGGTVRLTDRAAKILEAHVHLYGPTPQSLPIRSRKVGFSYTGSSLVALQAYAAVLPLWSRLQAQFLPTMGECAEHLAKFLRAYAWELAAAGDFRCHTECLLVGFDERAAHIEAWRIGVAPTCAGIVLSVEQVSLGSGEMALYGDGRAAAEAALAQLGRSSNGWRREPIEWIRSRLREDQAGSVGGGVQIGAVGIEGFELYFDAQPFRAGVNGAGDSLITLRYRGFDFGDISHVGQASVFLPGLAS